MESGKLWQSMTSSHVTQRENLSLQSASQMIFGSWFWKRLMPSFMGGTFSCEEDLSMKLWLISLDVRQFLTTLKMSTFSISLITVSSGNSSFISSAKVTYSHLVRKPSKNGKAEFFKLNKTKKRERVRKKARLKMEKSDSVITSKGKTVCRRAKLLLLYLPKKHLASN